MNTMPQLLWAAPILTCNNLDITVSCRDALDETPQPSVTSNCSNTIDITLTAVDDLSGLDVCGHSGVIIRTWTATDACSETATCIQTITVTNEAPILNCSNLDVTIECDASIGENNLPKPTFLDDCSSIDVLTLTYTDNETGLNNCGNTGTILRTWTATDACGLTATCIQTITIIDGSAPLVTCEPVDETHECNGREGNQFAALSWNQANISVLINCSTDNCGNVTVTSDYNFNHLSNDCGLTGSITVTYTIMEACGNSTTKVATFSIIDTTDPIVNCNPLDLTFECTSNPKNQQLAAAWDIENRNRLQSCAFDACGTNPTITSDFDYAQLNPNCPPANTNDCDLAFSRLFSPREIINEGIAYTFSGNLQFIKYDILAFQETGYLEMTLKEDLPADINRIELFIRDGMSIGGNRDREYWMYIDFRTNKITYRYDVTQVIKVVDINEDAKKAGAKYRFELEDDVVKLSHNDSEQVFDAATYPINEDRNLWIVIGGSGRVNVDFMSNLDCNPQQDELVVTYTIADECANTSTMTATLKKGVSELTDCSEISIQSTNNQLVITNITAPNTITKVYDPNWQIISNCSGDCPETVSIPTLVAGEIYHTDIQFYDEHWRFICEEKQDIEIKGGSEPCDTSICQGDVILRTQAEVDAFCGCQVIEGDLAIGIPGFQISGLETQMSDISNINSLKDIKRVNGEFFIQKTQLKNLIPLQVIYIGGSLSIKGNYQLESLNGLDNLKEIEKILSIENNDLIADLAPLANLDSIYGLDLTEKKIKDLLVFKNLKIKKLNQLQIERCENLKNLDGLEILESINFIGIGGNDILENINGIQNVKFVKALNIIRNQILTNCCAVVHLLDDNLDNGIIEKNDVTIPYLIYDNPKFCNSPEEIFEACQTLPPPCETIQILTQNNQIIIQGLTAPNEIVKVFDKDYNIVYQCVANCEDTQMAGTFPEGTYTIDLQLYNENWELICAEQRTVVLDNSHTDPCNSGGCETIPPVFSTIPMDITVACDAVPELPFLPATDNCDEDVEILFDETRTNNLCEDSYFLTRTWTAMDDCENSTTILQTITIIDNTNPILANIPADETVECDAIPSEPLNVTATDNCDSDVTLEFNEERTDGSCQDNYILTRTWIATDNCGNSTQGIQVISIQDITPPVLTNLPADLTFNAAEGFDTTFPIPTDNCDADVDLTVNDVINASETEIVRTFTATDNCGNSATAQQIITIIPDTVVNSTCEDILITASSNEIILTNITAPNAIVKVFDPNWQFIYECNASCDNEIIIPVEAIGIYHMDVQFYDENWQFICADKHDISTENTTSNCGNVFELTIMSEKDAMVWNGNSYDDYANRNYGNDPRLLVHAWTNSGIPDFSRSLLNFDLAQLPMDATILSATISLFNDRESVSFDGKHSGENTGIIQRITSNWEEELVTWNTQPQYTTQNEVRFSALSENQSLRDLDITALILDAKSDSNHSFGLMVRLENEQHYRALVFASSDLENTNFHPKLIVQYETKNNTICQGDVVLRTQAEVDAFCGCEVIEGKLDIGTEFFNSTDDTAISSDITSLANLSGISAVKGAISIKNTRITSLNGLDALKQVDNTLAIIGNKNLANLNGLEQLESIGLGFTIVHNPLIEHLNELENLHSIDRQITIHDNLSLKSIIGLASVESSILDRVIIRDNQNLINLDGLNNLVSIKRVTNGYIAISKNNNLIDISALKNIQLVEGDLIITQNPKLSACCIISHLLDDDLTNGQVIGDIIIGSNAQLCKSSREILESCPKEPTTPCEFILYNVNTNTSSLSIFNLTAPIQIVKVFDANYKTIYECFANCEETILVEDLPAGIYHIDINFYDENWQPICDKKKTVQIPTTAQNRNNDLLPADFSLFPNPAETEIFIDLNKLKGTAVQLALYNQFGQIVSQQVIEPVVNSKTKMDVSTISNGLYILKIQTKGRRTIVKKLIINRLY